MDVCKGTYIQETHGCCVSHQKHRSFLLDHLETSLNVFSVVKRLPVWQLQQWHGHCSLSLHRNDPLVNVYTKLWNITIFSWANQQTQWPFSMSYVTLPEGKLWAGTGNTMSYHQPRNLAKIRNALHQGLPLRNFEESLTFSCMLWGQKMYRHSD